MTTIGHAAIGRQEEEDAFLQVVVDAAPFPDGSGNGAEIVVRQNDARRFLRGFGTLDAHRQPDVGALQGRCVVDTISGHGRDFTVCLQGFDQPQLVFRTGTGKDVDFPGRPVSVRHRPFFRVRHL